jgi:hypothetical protein
MDTTGMEDQVGQQGSSLPRPQGQGTTRPQPSLKPPEKAEMHAPHRAQACGTSSYHSLDGARPSG